MKRTARLVLWLIALVVLAGVGYGVYHYIQKDEERADRVRMREAMIAELQSMARLCSMDIIEDVPIKGQIGTKHIFAKTTLNGTISFDLEGVNPEWRGDSVLLTLPKEIVEVYESTEPGAYQVIDTWNTGLFGSARFSTAEENLVKGKVKENFRNSLYRRGDVKRARAEAVENLTSMLTALTGKRVIVTDTMPEGSW